MGLRGRIEHPAHDLIASGLNVLFWNLFVIGHLEFACHRRVKLQKMTGFRRFPLAGVCISCNKHRDGTERLRHGIYLRLYSAGYVPHNAFSFLPRTGLELVIGYKGLGTRVAGEIGGGGGIRTHETYQSAGLGVRCIRPLCHATY